MRVSWSPRAGTGPGRSDRRQVRPGRTGRPPPGPLHRARYPDRRRWVNLGNWV